MNTCRALGLYVHIPFCVRKCHYCDFNSGPLSQPARERYLQALDREIRSSRCRGFEVRTVFFGGGTPSELTLHELESIVRAVHDTFRIDDGAECTVECNPGTVGPDYLTALRNLGFNRASLGVQSLQDHHLAALGRIHDSRQAREAYQGLRRAGFENVNLDLIFDLEGQTLLEWESDLFEVLSWSPEHLSLYHLTIEPGTEFGNRMARGEMRPQEEEQGARMYELAMDMAARAGFEQYEISNFCRPGHRCRHNLIYWRNEPYLGFGLSAASFLEGVRWTNTGRMGEYVRTASSGDTARSSEERLENREALGEEVMLRLRTGDGFSLADLSRRYSVDLLALHGKTLELFSRERLIDWEGDRVTLTRQGRLLANEVCRRFL